MAERVDKLINFVRSWDLNADTPLFIRDCGDSEKTKQDLYSQKVKKAILSADFVDALSIRNADNLFEPIKLELDVKHTGRLSEKVCAFLGLNKNGKQTPLEIDFLNYEEDFEIDLFNGKKRRICEEVVEINLQEGEKRIHFKILKLNKIWSGSFQEFAEGEWKETARMDTKYLDDMVTVADLGEELTKLNCRDNSA